MRIKFAVFLFSSTISLLAATNEPTLFTEVNSIERLTISGLLLVAVVFLYRELAAERKKSEMREEAMKAFIATQTDLLRQTTESQSRALGEVTEALGTQQSALEAQITVYREHINSILKAATKE